MFKCCSEREREEWASARPGTSAEAISQQQVGVTCRIYISVISLKGELSCSFVCGPPTDLEVSNLSQSFILLSYCSTTRPTRVCTHTREVKEGTNQSIDSFDPPTITQHPPPPQHTTPTHGHSARCAACLYVSFAGAARGNWSNLTAVMMR